MKRMNTGIKTEINKYFTYQNMFWLFMIANVTGVILEGIWTVMKFGRWETHVVTVWGPFCLLYGAGAVAFYFGSVLVQRRHPVLKFLCFAFIADILEYICSWMIENGLNMRAWTYKKHFMNLQGRISLQMTVVWGILGIVYFYCLVPRLEKLFHKMQGRIWRKACVIVSVFMVINMSFTAVCLVRWSNRHKGMAAANQIEEFLDQTYDDTTMQTKFCEWWFIDQQKEFWQEYKKK